MFNLLTGNCAQCKEIKDLPILRDGWCVCCDCNRMLTESVERGETAQCFYVIIRLVGCEVNLIILKILSAVSVCRKKFAAVAGN